MRFSFADRSEFLGDEILIILILADNFKKYAKLFQQLLKTLKVKLY